MDRKMFKAENNLIMPAGGARASSTWFSLFPVMFSIVFSPVVIIEASMETV